MDAIYAKSGTNLIGDDATRMASLKTNVLMSQKELDGLGVLSGQDEALTLEQIPDPTSVSENVKGIFGKDQYPAKISQYRKNLDNQYDATLEASGYTRAGGKKKDVAPAAGGPVASAKAAKVGVHGADLPD